MTAPAGIFPAGRKDDLMIIFFNHQQRDHFLEIRKKYNELIASDIDHQEKARLRIQREEECDAYCDQIMRDHVEELHGDPDAIVRDAMEQMSLVWKSEYDNLFKKSSPKGREDNVAMGIAEIVNGEILPKVSWLIFLAKDHLHYHIDALNKDVAHLRLLMIAIEDGAKTMSFLHESPEERPEYLRKSFVMPMSLDVMNDNTSRALLKPGEKSKDTKTNLPAMIWRVKTDSNTATTIALVNADDPQALSMEGQSVLCAIGNLYKAAMTTNSECFVTPQEIWRFMERAPGSYDKPSQDQVKTVESWVTLFRLTDTILDCSEEVQRRNLRFNDERIDGGKIRANQLEAREGEFRTEKGNVIKGYQILSYPPYLSYLEAKGHLVSVERRVLDVSGKVRDTRDLLPIKQYLALQIQLMKNAKKKQEGPDEPIPKGQKGSRFNRSNHILISSIYEYTQIPTPEARADEKEKKEPFKTAAARDAFIRKARSADRKKIEKLLFAWYEMKWIKGFKGIDASRMQIEMIQDGKLSETAKGRKIIGYAIQI